MRTDLSQELQENPESWSLVLTGIVSSSLLSIIMREGREKGREEGREKEQRRKKLFIKDRIKIRFIFYKGSSVPMLLNHHSENCQSYKVYIMLCY